MVGVGVVVVVAVGGVVGVGVVVVVAVGGVVGVGVVVVINMKWIVKLITLLYIVPCEASNVAQKAEKIGGRLYAAIVWHESLHGHWANGHDLGPAQVNRATAKAYGFDTARLETDTGYNLKCGYRVLRDTLKRWPGQWCRYNVGSGPLKGLKKEHCEQYKQKVEKERAALYGP